MSFVCQRRLHVCIHISKFKIQEHKASSYGRHGHTRTYYVHIKIISTTPEKKQHKSIETIHQQSAHSAFHPEMKHFIEVSVQKTFS